MTSPLDGFREWCPMVSIPSRDQQGQLGEPVRFSRFLGTQEYMLQEIEAGLAEGIHDFVILKGGRQIGGSTLWDALTLWWCENYSGIVGMMVSDDDDNRDYRRDVMVEMHDSLPRAFNRAVRRNNPMMLAWAKNLKLNYHGSRLLFAAAGKRRDSNLGRSKGLNLGYNDEVGSWFDQKAYSALRNSRSQRHPLRLYGDVSTARGINTLWHGIWKSATAATTQRAIFAAWWRNEENALDAERDRLRWERYALDPGDPTEDEWNWMREVSRRYGVTITPGQLAWYRFMLAEEFRGDETMLAQEFGCLPEDCFQAFGEKFVAPHLVAKMRHAIAAGPPPTGYRYRWSEYLPNVEVIECAPEDADLRVWEEPDPGGVYIIAAHPWGAAGPSAREFVVSVWRAWPDRLRQVAEFASDSSLEMYHFAWVCLHLCGCYRTFTPPYFVLEIAMSGQSVLAELDRIENLGDGLGPVTSLERNRMVNMLGSVQYLFRRLDTFSGSVLRQMKLGNSEDVRALALYDLRGEIGRGRVEPRSLALVDQLAMLRRGEDEDADTVGTSEEARAITLALTIQAWHSQAMEDLMLLLAPREPDKSIPSTVEQYMVSSFLGRLRETGETG